MNIAIPTLGADGGKSGISQYLIQILRALAALQTPHRFSLLVQPGEEDVFAPEDDERFALTPAPAVCRRPASGVAWVQAGLSAWLRKVRADAVFMPAANRRLAWRYPCPSVGTVHDFSSLHVPAKYDPARMVYIKRVLPWLVRRLDRVITVSESSRRDIVDYARVPDERVSMTPLACDTARFHPAAPDDARACLRRRYDLNAPYFIYISRIEHPGKNHFKLIRAYDLYRQCAAARGDDARVLLVLAGSDWNGAEAVHEAAEQSSYSDDIRFLGFVPQGDTPELYRSAEAMIFPSLFEGFGLPVLEAMACGTPVACSDRSSLPEVAGGAALLFDPDDPRRIAPVLERLANDAGLRESLRRRGLRRARDFSWRRTAEMTLEAIERTARETPHSHTWS